MPVGGLGDGARHWRVKGPKGIVVVVAICYWRFSPENALLSIDRAVFVS